MCAGYRCIVILSLVQCFIVTGDVLAQDSIDKDYADQLPRIAPLEPAEALKRFELSSALQIELMASEPDVVDPVAIAFDEFGRAYVAEMRGYSLQQDERLGRIKLLEDKDRDGKFETATVFADDLTWPTAVCCAFGGVLVGDAPNIWFMKDTDDDGVADIREKVFTGFGTRNIQQLLNNFQWGIDNRIYGAAGGNGGIIIQLGKVDRSGFTRLEQTQDDNLSLRSMDFVIDPRSFEMSAIAGGGQFGMTFDSAGSRFVCSNSDHCQQMVLDLRHVNRNRFARVGSLRRSIALDGPAAPVFRISPVEPWRVVRTRLRVQGIVGGPIEGGGRAAGYFTSATGIHSFSGDALEPRFVENIFIGDVGSNLVHRKTLQRDGVVQAAQRAESQREFLRSTDNWFRPVQISDGPDGSLIVLDMYREVVEHPDSLPPIIKKHLDLASGQDRGRIYRIFSKKKNPQRRKFPGEATQLELVEMLGHSNGWHRRTAARLLAEGKLDSDSIARLKMVASQTTNPETRIRALYLLQSDNDFPAVVRQALRDREPSVRVHALRLAEELLPDPDMERQILTLAGDSDIRVLFQLALMLGMIESLESDDVFALLAVTDGSDPWMRNALSCAMGVRRGSRFVVLMKSMDAGRQKMLRPLLMEMAWQLSRDSQREEQAQVLEALATLSDEMLVAELLLQLTSGPAQQSNEWQQAIADSADGSLTALLDRKIQESFGIANDVSKRESDRVRAIQILRHAPEDEFAQAFGDWIGWQQSVAVSRAALETAGSFSSKEIGETIVESLPSQIPEIRNQSVSVLLSRNTWASGLLTEIENGRISAVLLDASARQRLLSHPNEAIRTRAKYALPASGEEDRNKLVEKYLQEMESMTGDVDRGRKAFEKSCTSCHRIENRGNVVGPDLAAFGNRGQHAIVSNVLNPNQEIDPRYLSTRMLLVDGRMILGVISSETDAWITLNDENGKTVIIEKDEIEEFSSTTKSLMPANLESEVDPQAMADIVEYLMSLVNR